MQNGSSAKLQSFQRFSHLAKRIATDTYILVVEGNLINQQVLVKQLKKIGAKVNAANDGVEALEVLKLTHFVYQKV